MNLSIFAGIAGLQILAIILVIRFNIGERLYYFFKDRRKDSERK